MLSGHVAFSIGVISKRAVGYRDTYELNHFEKGT